MRGGGRRGGRWLGGERRGGKKGRALVEVEAPQGWGLQWRRERVLQGKRNTLVVKIRQHW